LWHRSSLPRSWPSCGKHAKTLPSSFSDSSKCARCRDSRTVCRCQALNDCRCVALLKVHLQVGRFAKLKLNRSFDSLSEFTSTNAEVPVANSVSFPVRREMFVTAIALARS
jgi:hypothetical protein